MPEADPIAEALADHIEESRCFCAMDYPSPRSNCRKCEAHESAVAAQQQYAAMKASHAELREKIAGLIQDAMPYRNEFAEGSRHTLTHVLSIIDNHMKAALATATREVTK